MCRVTILSTWFGGARSASRPSVLPLQEASEYLQWSSGPGAPVEEAAAQGLLKLRGAEERESDMVEQTWQQW